MKQSTFTGNLAIVTGASSGIGREIAICLAQRGFRLILIARRQDRLDQLAQSLSTHTRCVGVTLDLADAHQRQAVFRKLILEHGHVRVLVNNAGYGMYRRFLDLTEDEHRRLFEVNYFAAADAMRAVLPGMLQRREGHVINLASVAAKMGPWGHGPYAAAKSALQRLTQTLAAEHAGTQVAFSCVLPGLVRTEFFDHDSYRPLKTFVHNHGLTAEALAKKITALLDRPRLELCVPRHHRVLDWVYALNPALAHRLVQAGTTWATRSKE